jgi:hypothetical protein
MVTRMKTTLVISDVTVRELKREAMRQGRTMSELVEAALRAMLQARAARRKLPPLPEFRSGGSLVDVADRNALYGAMGH